MTQNISHFCAFYRMSLDKSRAIKSMRFNTVQVWGSYPPFEEIARHSKDNRFFCYLRPVHYFGKSEWLRHAGLQITNCKNISLIFRIPDNPCVGYGDMSGTADGLIFRFNYEFTQMDIFVAKGYKFSIADLFNEVLNHHYDDELVLMELNANYVEDIQPNKEEVHNDVK